MANIVAVGELLIDFTPSTGELFQANPGGAPCNYLAIAQKMGSKTAFIGKVGADAFGNKLREVLNQQGIDTRNLIMDPNFGTTLAFVHLSERGERSFSFYRHGCADTMLDYSEVDLQIIDKATVFHFGSLSFTDEPSRSTVLRLLDYAKAKGKIITYDPNYRAPLWRSSAEAIKWMLQGMHVANIVKVSDEELNILTGSASFETGCSVLHHMGVQMILVTLGEKGVYYSYKNGSGIVKGVPAQVVDTTGAGDTFFGAAIHQILSLGTPIDSINVNDLKDILLTANVAAAICVEGFGGIPSIPSREQVEERLKTLKE